MASEWVRVKCRNDWETARCDAAGCAAGTEWFLEKVHPDAVEAGSIYLIDLETGEASEPWVASIVWIENEEQYGMLRRRDSQIATVTDEMELGICVTREELCSLVRDAVDQGIDLTGARIAWDGDDYLMRVCDECGDHPEIACHECGNQTATLEHEYCKDCLEDSEFHGEGGR